MKTKINVSRTAPSLALLILLLFTFHCPLFTSLSAQKPNPFSAKTAGSAKAKALLDFPDEGRNSKNGGGYSANMDLVNPKPKRIALVSYYLYDPAMGAASGGVYTGTATAKIWRSSDAQGQQHVDGFYQESIDAMKKAFSDQGMTLLTPEEFLDTDEKDEFYYGFNQESARKEKTDASMRRNAGTSISTIAEATVSTLKVCPSNKGYRAFFIANEKVNDSEQLLFRFTGAFGANRKLTSNLGYELCKGLDVDAVLVTFITTRKMKMTKDDYGVHAVSMYMLGPNPKADGAEDKNRGQFYAGARFYSTKPLLFHTAKGGAQYDGMDNVMAGLSTKITQYVNGTK
jgi:hypothetical protein